MAKNDLINPLEALSPEIRQKYQQAVDESLAKIHTLPAPTMEKLRKRLRNRENISKHEIIQTLPDPHDQQAQQELNFILEDQTRKSMGILDRIKAEADGALGFIWRTHPDQKPGPKAHPYCQHLKHDGKLYVFSNSPAVRDGYITANANVLYTEQLGDELPSVAVGCRCVARYIYSLKSIPRKMLTPKGQSFIDRKQ